MPKEKEEEEKIKGPFQFDYKWWDKNRPALLPSTGLGKALKAYEDAKGKAKSAPKNFQLFLDARVALIDADKARDAAAKKCGSLFKKTKATLENSEAALKAEHKELHDAVVPVLTDELTSWNKRVGDLAHRFDGEVKVYTNLIQRVKAKDSEAIKSALKLVNTESSYPVPNIRPALFTALDLFSKARRNLEKDFPDQYRGLDEFNEDYAKGLGPKLNEVNILHSQLKETLTEEKLQ